MEVKSKSRDGSKCPVCMQGTLRDSVREESVEYRGHTFTSREPGAYCDACGDGIAYPNPTGENQWLAFRKRVDEAEQQELRKIRAQLGLTQIQASSISGGGHNAFSRYERGEAQPLICVLHLFRLLARYPHLISELGLGPTKIVAYADPGSVIQVGSIWAPLYGVVTASSITATAAQTSPPATMRVKLTEPWQQTYEVEKYAAT